MNEMNMNDTSIGYFALFVVVVCFAFLGFRYAQQQDKMTLCNNYAHQVQSQ